MTIQEAAKKVSDYLIKNSRRTIYTFGNGGSASIANHMACDWMKGTQGFLKVVSLSSNGSLLSAIGNDIGYEETCTAQLSYLGLGSSDVLVLVSSSGTSKNIVNAVIEARSSHRGRMVVIGFSGNARGSDGGILRSNSDISVHCNSQDYGTIEDFHSQVMHQVLRNIKSELTRLDKKTQGKVK